MGGKIKSKRTDRYSNLAKSQGFRSRAAFKLIQLNRKYDFLSKARTILDLCAAPGSWMQVASKNCPRGSTIVGVDLLPIKSIPNCLSLQEDITTQKCRDSLRKLLKAQHEKVDLVLHDGAPNMGEAWLQDAFTQNLLVLHAAKLAAEFLRPNGVFVSKIFRSKDYDKVLFALQKLFKKVSSTKPPSSRSQSAEIFLVCEGFKDVEIDPRLLDPKFALIDLEPAQRKNIFARKKQPVNRGGYHDEETADYTPGSAAGFVEAPGDALAWFDRYAKFTFDDPLSRVFLKHPATTPEVLALCGDLRVCSKGDLRKVVAWRKRLRVAFRLDAPAVPTHVKDPAVRARAQREAGEVQKEIDEHQRQLRSKDSVPGPDLDPSALMDVDVDENEGEKDAEEEALERAEDERERELAELELELTAEERERRAAARRRERKRRRRERRLAERRALAADAEGRTGEIDLFDLQNVAKHGAAVRAVVAGAGGDRFAHLQRRDETKALRRAELAARAAAAAELTDEEALELEYLSHKERSTRDASKKEKRWGWAPEIEGPETYGAEDADADGWARAVEGSSGSDGEWEEAEWADGATEMRAGVVEAAPQGDTVGEEVWFARDVFGELGVDPEAGALDLVDLGAEDCGDAGDPKSPKLTDWEIEDQEEQLRKRERRKERKTERKVQEQGGDIELAPPRLREGGGAAHPGYGAGVGVGGNVDGVDADDDEGADDVANEADADADDDTDDEAPRVPDWLEEDPEERLVTLALAKKLLTKRGRREMEELSFNRYAFNEDPGELPVWFREDEQRNSKLVLPVTKADVEEERHRLMELNARPIKKVAEARWRKKRRVKAASTKARDKAEEIAKSGEMSERAKMQAIKKLYKASGSRKIAPTLIVRRRVVTEKAMHGRNKSHKPSKGSRVKYVDPRMKKDARAKAKADKKGKGPKKPMGGSKKQAKRKR